MNEQEKQEWRKENTKLYGIRLNRTGDSDIIQWLKTKKSASAVIKSMIRNQIAWEQWQNAPEIIEADSTEEASILLPSEEYEECMTTDAMELTNEELSERINTGRLFDILNGTREANKRFKWYLDKGLLPRLSLIHI